MSERTNLGIMYKFLGFVFCWLILWIVILTNRPQSKTNYDFTRIQDETRWIMDCRGNWVINQFESSEEYWNLLTREEKLKLKIKNFIKKPGIGLKDKKEAERILVFLNSDMSLKKANSDIFQEKFGKEIDSIP